MKLLFIVLLLLVLLSIVSCFSNNNVFLANIKNNNKNNKNNNNNKNNKNGKVVLNGSLGTMSASIIAKGALKGAGMIIYLLLSSISISILISLLS